MQTRRELQASEVISFARSHLRSSAKPDTQRAYQGAFARPCGDHRVMRQSAGSQCKRFWACRAAPLGPSIKFSLGPGANVISP